jgi:VanZ family protein
MARIIWHVLSLAVALGIFLSSALSGEVSGYASRTIAVFAQHIMPLSHETIGVIHFLVRKGAHFFVYLLLAFCVTHSLKFYIHKMKNLFFSAWGIASLYGITDEVHQYFVPGRVMSLTDMLINSGGASAGALLVLVWINLQKK